MARKPTFFANIFTDWDVLPRPDITQAQWENGVKETLQDLVNIPPCKTSRAVLDAIHRSGKTVTIVPERQPLLPDKADANAHADPTDPLTATRLGGKPDNPPSPSALGVGGGSDVVLAFVAQDWDPATSTASLRAVDETLLHELVHALRQAAGVEDTVPLHAPFAVLRKGDGSVSQLMAGTTGNKPTKFSQIYNEYEEFAAILITNIYRSENGRPGLRRDHLGGDAELTYPLTNARTFMTVWRPQIDQLCGEIRAVADQVAMVDCGFNPLFELYAAEDKFLPGKRQVRP
jgi:hypothetical protein